MSLLALGSKSESGGEKGKRKSTSPTRFMPRKYKVIVAPTIDRLQVLVNAFLESPDSDGFEYLGAPQVFGHEEYTQAFVNQFYFEV
jgi:hypothetical protein